MGLCANKCIDARIREKKPGFYVSWTDLEKANDYVNWDLLLYVLRHYGFGVKLREWMWKCISLASFSVLINGVTKGYFGFNRGLCYGNPLSPLPFLMVASVLG